MTPERRAIGDPDPLWTDPEPPRDFGEQIISQNELGRRIAAGEKPGCWIFPFLAGLLVMAWRMR